MTIREFFEWVRETQCKLFYDLAPECQAAYPDGLSWMDLTMGQVGITAFVGYVIFVLVISFVLGEFAFLFFFNRA